MQIFAPMTSSLVFEHKPIVNYYLKYRQK